MWAMPVESVGAGAEIDAKDLVFVVVDQRDDLAAGAVPIEQGAGIELGNFFRRAAVQNRGDPWGLLCGVCRKS